MPLISPSSEVPNKRKHQAKHHKMNSKKKQKRQSAESEPAINKPSHKRSRPLQDPSQSPLSRRAQHDTISAPVYTGPCRFSGLPAEIRNVIYDHVLANPDGLTVRTHPNFSRQRHKKRTLIAYGRMSDTSLGIFNKLSLVNRQLRHGTKGLEFKMNALIFGSHGIQFHGVRGLYRYRDLCGAPKLKWLTHIILTMTQGESEISPNEHYMYNLDDSVMQAAEFSATNRHIRVDFHFELWDPMKDNGVSPIEALQFLLIRLILSNAIRGVDISCLTQTWLTYLRVPSAGRVVGPERAWRLEELGGRLGNICFRPVRHPGVPFCRQAFKMHVTRYQDHAHMPPDGNVDPWLDVVELWNGNGI